MTSFWRHSMWDVCPLSDCTFQSCDIWRALVFIARITVCWSLFGKFWQVFTDDLMDQILKGVPYKIEPVGFFRQSPEVQEATPELLPQPKHTSFPWHTRAQSFIERLGHTLVSLHLFYTQEADGATVEVRIPLDTLAGRCDELNYL